MCWLQALHARIYMIIIAWTSIRSYLFLHCSIGRLKSYNFPGDGSAYSPNYREYFEIRYRVGLTFLEFSHSNRSCHCRISKLLKTFNCCVNHTVKYCIGLLDLIFFILTLPFLAKIGLPLNIISTKGLVKPKRSFEAACIS